MERAVGHRCAKRQKGGEREREGSSLVITLSIRPLDGLHQPPGLMFDRIIRKLSQSVITGAHLAQDHFHPSRAHAGTQSHLNTQWAVAICGQPARRDADVVEW